MDLWHLGARLVVIVAGYYYPQRRAVRGVEAAEWWPTTEAVVMVSDAEATPHYNKTGLSGLQLMAKLRLRYSIKDMEYEEDCFYQGWVDQRWNYESKLAKGRLVKIRYSPTDPRQIALVFP